MQNIILSIWATPWAMALCALAFYGFSSPMAKVGLIQGASPSGMLMAYGLSSTVMAVLWNWFGGVPIIYGSGLNAAPVAFISALMSGLAYLSMMRSMTIGTVTLTMAFVGGAPIIAALFEMAFLKAHLKWPQALCGIALVVVGAYLVATSKLAPAR